MAGQVAGQEAVVGMLDDQGCTQPGYKAVGWEGRQDQLDKERKRGMRMKGLKMF